MAITEEEDIACAEAVYLPGKNTRECSPQLPLPGVVILVHGVNSDGEWYEATEQGLCEGLNTRLARRPEQMAIPGFLGGQILPSTYTPELTDAGFLNRERNAQTFIDANAENYSPVIRFRWGYKANKKDLAEYGANVWLNENSYWGGGPFANGCSSIADLWADGLNDRLFLWITAQHLNPERGRDVYACPPRHYYAFAAKRLAELVKLIRSKQADVPITIVCHSQGNMIGIGAAFYGAQLGDIEDPSGRKAPAVADNYVLANAPYSLVEENMGTDNWAQRYTTNMDGQSGRQTGSARKETLANFLQHIRNRQEGGQTEAYVDKRCGNVSPLDGSPGYKVGEDWKQYGKKGRVTLYFNPHDRVISALTVQGIGWRGLDKKEISVVNGNGVFVQRVWAQGNPVGKKGEHLFWDGTTDFWHPKSRVARFSLEQGMEASRNAVGKVLTMVTAPIAWFLVAIAGAFNVTRINATPPKGRKLPIEAPEVPTHIPQAQRLGNATAFDQGMDPDTDLLRAVGSQNPEAEEDSYDRFRKSSPDADSESSRESEARLRYEHRARLRMKASRAGMDAKQADVSDEKASPEWKTWSREQVTNFLKESIDQHATDHSTIMTCAANLEHVLAYDVAVGVSRLSNEDWGELRIAADWQLWKGVKKGRPLSEFGYYFETGLWTNDVRLHEHDDFKPSACPPGIKDERANKSSGREQGGRE